MRVHVCNLDMHVCNECTCVHYMCTCRLYKVFWYIEIHKPLAKQGAALYTVVFYVLTGMLAVSVAICM